MYGSIYCSLCEYIHFFDWFDKILICFPCDDYSSIIITVTIVMEIFNTHTHRSHNTQYIF